jgi:PhnB protein
VYVEDIDAHSKQAKASGVNFLSLLEDNPGVSQRNYRAEDLEGHRWMFAQPT